MGSRRGHRRLRGPWHPRCLESPGDGRGPRPGRPERDHLHRRGVGQVARLPATRAHLGAGGRHRALCHAHQGARGRPARVDPLARPARGAGGHLRRRLDLRRAGLGAQPCQVPADHPGHAAPRAAARAQALVGVLQQAALRDHRRVPRLPGRLRLACGPRAAPAPPGRSASRPAGWPAAPGLRARLRHGRDAGCLRPAAHRARRRGSDRGRLTARAACLRAVGAAADRCPRRGGRPAAPHGHRAGGGPARQAGQGERPDARLHQVPARRRGGTGAAWRRPCPTVAWSGWPPPPRSNSGSISPAWTRC